MQTMTPHYKQNGDSAILIEFDNVISEAVNDAVHQFAAAIIARQLDDVKEVVPSYRSLCVHYDAVAVDYSTMVAALEAVYAERATSCVAPAQIIEIPVCYEMPYALDLARVAAHNHLTPDEVVAIHSSADYRIYMLGFAPGFPYLGGIDKRIATPRLAVPRLAVAAGSVGIAGEQTGIYPLDSPAGWQIIGRTPLKLYDAQRERPILLRAGDYLHFYPISAARFAEIEMAGSAYQLITRPYRRVEL